MIGAGAVPGGERGGGAVRGGDMCPVVSMVPVVPVLGLVWSGNYHHGVCLEITSPHLTHARASPGDSGPALGAWQARTARAPRRRRTAAAPRRGRVRAGRPGAPGHSAPPPADPVYTLIIVNILVLAFDSCSSSFLYQ